MTEFIKAPKRKGNSQRGYSKAKDSMARYSKMKNLLQYCQRETQAIGKQWDKSWLSSFSSVFYVIVKAFLNHDIRRSFSEAGDVMRKEPTAQPRVSSQVSYMYTWRQALRPFFQHLLHCQENTAEHPVTEMAQAVKVRGLSSPHLTPTCWADKEEADCMKPAEP